jgi:SAM-dependent methyltransferase
MGIRAIIGQQFGKPSGIVGRLIGWLMAVSNKELSAWTVEKINARGTDRILEVGYGPGVALSQVADQLTMGMIAGVDHSETMYRMAQKRNFRHITRKKAFLRCGTIDDLGYPRMYFDTIYGANVHFFWKHPVKEFTKLRRLLKADGKLLIIFQPRWSKTAGEIREMANTCRVQLEQAGFSSVKVELKRAKPVTMISVTASTKVGRKPGKIVNKKFLQPDLQTERLD